MNLAVVEEKVDQLRLLQEVTENVSNFLAIIWVNAIKI